MIKKSIASVLISLIFINSIGCYTFSQVNIEDAEEIEKDDEVEITTLAEEIYILTDVTIEGSEVKGFVVLSRYERLEDIQAKEIVIATEQIKRIEVLKLNQGLTILTVFGIPIAVLAIVVGNQMAKGYR